MSNIFNQSFEGFQNQDTRFQNNFNAKIYLNENDNPPNYDLYVNSNNQQQNFKNSLVGIQEKSELSTTYFSKSNVDVIQNNIQSKIYEESGGQYRIGRQSDLQLQIIMRSIYLSYSKNMNTDINQQVQELNNLVIGEAVSNILPNIRQYLGYRNDISTPRHIISHPINPSSSGEKTYSLINF